MLVDCEDVVIEGWMHGSFFRVLVFSFCIHSEHGTASSLGSRNRLDKLVLARAYLCLQYPIERTENESGVWELLCAAALCLSFSYISGLRGLLSRCYTCNSRAFTLYPVI